MDRSADVTILLSAFVSAATLVVVSFLTLPAVVAAISSILGLAMLGIVLADNRWFIVPDALSLPAIILGLLASGRLVDPVISSLTNSDHIIGMVAGGFGFWLIRTAYAWWRRQEGLGLGDVKLAAAAGAWVGWQDLANVVLLAGSLALAAIAIASLVAGRRISASDKLPFGCFLAPSIWLVWFVGVYSRVG